MNKVNKQVFVRTFLVWMLVFIGAVSLSGCGETISYNSGDSSETTGTEAVSGNDGSEDGSGEENMSGDSSKDGFGEEDISGDSSKDVQEEDIITADGSEGKAGNGSTDGNGDDVTSGGELCVFVCGAVKNEGLYYLPAGSRYNDALTSAGGFAEDADTSGINLAAFVTDGEKIYFPHEGEVVAGGGNLSTDDGQSAGSEGTSAGGQSSGSGNVSDGRVNINTASEEELTGLSGIGQKKARAIVEYRNQNGAFSSIDEIKNVNGIGNALYEKIKDSICI